MKENGKFDVDQPEMEDFGKLGPQVHRALEYYVYLYKDPDTGAPFYVGKGVGDRILAHHGVEGECDKGRILDICLLYTSPSPRDKRQSRMPSSA